MYDLDDGGPVVSFRILFLVPFHTDRELAVVVFGDGQKDNVVIAEGHREKHLSESRVFPPKREVRRSAI